MIVNKNIVKNNKYDNSKQILQSYYDEHKKKFNEFTVKIFWKKNDVIINKISVPCTITFQKTHMFKPDIFELPIYVEVSEREFLEIVDRNCANNIISDKIDIILITKFKEMTLQHYMKQPRSMLCGKLEGNYIEEEGDVYFDCNFLPYCFRHIGFQPSPLLNT